MPIVLIRLVLQMGLRRLHNWHCLTMPIVHIRLVLRMGLRRLHKWHCLTMPIVHPLVVGMGLRRLHNWHCLSMPIVWVLDNPLPQSGRQCQLCRQCLLCRGPTMPFVQTMPIMRLGHCVPKVKLPSCQFPLYAYLALSMAFFGFKISIHILPHFF